MAVQINGTSGITLPSTPAAYDSDGSAASTAFVQSALSQGGALAGMRNRIINGNCNIAQRGTSVIATSGTNTFFGGPDRFPAINFNAGGQFTQSQGSLVFGGVTKNTIRQTVNTAPTSIASNNYWNGVEHRIEGYNAYDLLGQTVTVSFIFNTNVPGTYALALRDGSVGNSFITTFTIAAANTPTRITKTIALPVSLAIPNSNAAGLFLNVGFLNTATNSTSTLNTWLSGNFTTASTQTNWAATAANFIELTELQLEQGSTATPFEFRPYTTELQLCQRYYEILGPAQMGAGFGGTTGGWIYGAFMVPKRTAASTGVSLGTQVIYCAANNVNLTSTITNVSTNLSASGAFASFTCTGAAIGSAGFLTVGSSGIGISAEL